MMVGLGSLHVVPPRLRGAVSLHSPPSVLTFAAVCCRTKNHVWMSGLFEAVSLHSNVKGITDSSTTWKNMCVQSALEDREAQQEAPFTSQCDEMFKIAPLLSTSALGIVLNKASI